MTLWTSRTVLREVYYVTRRLRSTSNIGTSSHKYLTCHNSSSWPTLYSKHQMTLTGTVSAVTDIFDYTTALLIMHGADTIYLSTFNHDLHLRSQSYQVYVVPTTCSGMVHHCCTHFNIFLNTDYFSHFEFCQVQNSMWIDLCHFHERDWKDYRAMQHPYHDGRI